MNRRFLLAAVLALGLPLALPADTVVVFNEIMYHPPANETNLEWLELRNQMAVDVDVSGWSLAGAVHYSFPSNSIVPGGGYVVVALAPEALAAATRLTNLHGPFTGRLGNHGDHLELRNNNGRVVDQTDYDVQGDWPVAPDGSGASLAKLDRDGASGPPGNWVASAEVGGTPGADNFPFHNNTPPEVVLLPLETEWKFEDSGTDLGASWHQPGYDDAAWLARSSISNLPIRSLFNTGVDDTGTVLAPTSLDSHYLLITAPQGATNTNALVILNHPSWLANDTFSSWLGVLDPGSSSVNVGTYIYRTTFSLQGYLLSTVRLALAIAVDNDVTNLLLNGVSTGITASGFAALSDPSTLTTGFLSGTNTLEFQTSNAGTAANPHGFRATLSGTGLATNANLPLAANRSTYYFRKTFVLDRDPAYTSLRLRTFLTDGAVVYLNGLEVYRQNLPEGPVGYSTPASVDVPTPTYNGPLPISTASLVAGTNLLAVELHQAASSLDGPLLGVELFASPLPVPPIPLVFNETAAGAQGEFWVELMNPGGSPVALDGLALRLEGSTNLTYLFPSNNLFLAAGGFLALTNTTLGFQPLPGDKLFLVGPSGTAVLDGVVVKTNLSARFPDGTGPWLRPQAPTPGAANTFSFRDEIVFNEIMYQHALLPPTNQSQAPRPSPEQWVELFNRSSNAVDLTGWEIGGGISYRFTPGQTLAAGAYLVVAKDAASLRATYPSIPIVGDFGRNLSAKSDTIVLQDPDGNPACQVHYFDAAPWPEYADGGGSTVELRDPNADPSKPESWAPSDESGQTTWRTYSYRMIAAVPSGSGQPAQWNDFIFGLLDVGECLLDDLVVLESPGGTPIQLVGNGDFENGLAGWRALGTHGHSRIETDPENPANHVLHVVATGPQEHMHNHLETTLLNNRVVVQGREYQISFRARWLAGNNLLNTRLYFNRCARTTALPRPALNGTPGARNSRFEPNAGPTFGHFQHQPVVPQPAEPVSVSVEAQDPQGVGACEVWWAVNGGSWSNAPMTRPAPGRYVGTLPGYPAGSLVQFYVRATDGLGTSASYPAAGPDSGAFYVVADGQANLSLGHNLRLILSPANTALLHASTNVESNDKLPATVIYDEKRAYYNTLIRLRSSERGRYSDIRVGYHIVFPADDPFRGVHPCMIMTRSGAGDALANKQQEIVVKHMLHHAGGIAETYADLCRVIAPRPAVTGPAQLMPRHKDEFIETAFANGGDGIVWKFELIYYPTTTNQFGYKNPNPDNVVGTDISNLGDDKEIYRYNFILKNHRDADDYSRLIAFAKTFSLSGTALEQATQAAMDRDEWMRAWAILSLSGIGDTYTFGNNHNLLLYQRPSDQKILALLWDMSFSFNQATTANLVGDQNLSRIISLTPNLRLFYAHMLDLIASTYNTSYMTYWVNHYMKFCPGQDFRPALAYIQARGDYAKSVILGAGGNSPFAVNGSNFLVLGSNLVTLTGTAPVTARTITVNDREYPITWVNLYTWSIRLPVTDPTNVLEVVGRDLSGQAISNFSRTLTVAYTNAVPEPRGAVVINEIMYHPASPEAAYVELFNTSSHFTFDLSGWRVNGLAFTFPAGSFILPRQYLVLAKDTLAYLAAYGSNAPIPLATFSGTLQNSGETLTLLKPGAIQGQEVVIDQVRYEGARPWAPDANGTGSSLQLVDPAQDHSRPCNWFSFFRAAYTNYDWTFVSVTGRVANVNRVMIYLNEPGDIYLDDLSLVAGNVPAVGSNYIRNGDFESPLVDPPTGTNDWLLGTNYTGSALSTAQHHGGNGSFHLVGTSAGAASTLKMLSQYFIPAPAGGATAVFSFWYLPTTTATNLIARILNTTMNLSVTARPAFVPAIVFATPGSNNLTTVTNLAPIPPLWLNELQAENVSGPLDGAGHREPWLELHNAGTNVQSLAGLYLANGYSNLAQWAFPAGSALQPGEFKVIFADGVESETTSNEWHTSFRLEPGTGAVALSRLSGGRLEVLDYLNYSALRPDRSYGAFPDGQLFDRQEFYRVTPGRTNDNTAAPLSARINEWMAANTHTLLNTNNGNRYDDWFELFNPGDQPADLGGFFLTDTLSDPFAFAIPAGYVIPPHGFLLVWADNRPALNQPPFAELHVNFKLNRGGEVLALFASDGTLIDGLTYGPQSDDLSQGRYPDGQSSTGIMATPTPGRPNQPPALGANHPPVLTPLGPQHVTLGQTLRFTVLATDDEAPPQTLTYTLDPGAPAGATLNSVNGQFTWTPLPSQTPSTNQVTVRVTDNGIPPAEAFQTLTLTVWPPPQVRVLAPSAGSLVVAFGTVPGGLYRLEFKDRLEAPSWTPVLENVLGDGGESRFTADLSAHPQGFYRVVQIR